MTTIMTGSKKMAIERRNGIDDKLRQLEAMLKAEGYKYHHSASRKGYLTMSAGGASLRDYAGRFGEGYIIALPNRYAPAGRHGHFTNNYYVIRYYLK